MTTRIGPYTIPVSGHVDEHTVLLQGVGRVPAIVPEKLQPGNIVMFNYGKTAEVIKVSNNRMQKFVALTLRHDAAGTAGTTHDHIQRRKRDDKVALSPLPEHRRQNPQVREIMVTLKAIGMVI
jgi:hypothetical protein